MTAGSTRPPGATPLAQLAREKLTRVLGEARAARVYDEALAAAGLTEIREPDELYAFGAQLARRSGFEAAVGSLLTVAAVVRGARPEPK